jgi:lipopolysaccharide transport system ATP-binding protein
MSSNSEVAISTRGLGKMYTLYDHPHERLMHTLLWRFGKSYGSPFWALKNLDLEIYRGETFGVIGRNGSGKSTLLQLLAGILTPTSGDIKVNGRVGALLELGSGFNPEFTGRENVLLYSAILDIPRQEMVDNLDKIIDFADIGEFIDQPVKYYSSGMFVRLAFSVIANVNAEILLVDEALAVGDIFFRQKCYKHLEDIRSKGVTIILVSHAMNEVEQFCHRALLLADGENQFLGSSIEAVKRYYLLEARYKMTSLPALEVDEQDDLDAILTPADAGFWPAPEVLIDLSGTPQVSDGLAECTAVGLCDESGKNCRVFQQGTTASFYFEFQLGTDIEVPVGGVEIVNEKGIIVHGKNNLMSVASVPFFVRTGQRVRFRQDICLDIAPGDYTFNLGLTTISKQDFTRRASLPHEELDGRITVLNNVPQVGVFSVVYNKNAKPVQLPHFGVANLPGNFEVMLYQPTRETTT